MLKKALIEKRLTPDVCDRLLAAGFPGVELSDKTVTVEEARAGRRLAEEKKMPFVDLDAEIERRAGRRIAEIFAQDGEAAFRAMEAEELRRVAAEHGQVVALGGGALLAEGSRALAEKTGRVVFIECAEGELLRRVAASQDRPLLAGGAEEKMRALLAARREHYASFKERIVVGN